MITLDAVRAKMVDAQVKALNDAITNGKMGAADGHWSTLNAVVEELAIEAEMSLMNFLIDFPEVAAGGIRLMAFRHDQREYEANSV